MSLMVISLLLALMMVLLSYDRLRLFALVVQQFFVKSVERHLELRWSLLLQQFLLLHGKHLYFWGVLHGYISFYKLDIKWVIPLFVFIFIAKFTARAFFITMVCHAFGAGLPWITEKRLLLFRRHSAV